MRKRSTKYDEETIEAVKELRPRLRRIAESDGPFSDRAEQALRRLARLE